MQKIPKRVTEIAEQLAQGQPSRRFRVRAILKWFGAARRGAKIVEEIEFALSSVGLVTEPQLNKTPIDEQVRFLLTTQPTASVADAQTVDASPESDEFDEDPSEAKAGQNGGTKKANQLDAATPSEDQLEPEGEEEQESNKPDDHPVTSEIRDWTISSLREKKEKGLLVLQPHFQREYVWDLKPELPSRLIESILLKIPIPPIYFGKAAQGHLEVIDGQQRLTALMRFVGNEFALRKLHSMSSLNGKLFKELTTQEQERILDEPIRTIVIDAADNTELRYEIFERLNRGSMALNEQEIRNCVYRGPFNELLAELEKENNWRKVKGGAAPEHRFKERETILRFFAFANRLQQYTGKLKHFLNEYMAQYAPKEPQQLKAHTAQFRQTIQNIYAVFGDKAGRLYDVNSRTNRGAWDSKFSVLVFEIQAAALMNRSAAKVQQAAEQIGELFLFTMLSDTALQDAISKRTGSTAQTKVRWTKFRDLVDPIIDGTLIEPRFFDWAFRRELFDKSPTCLLCSNQIHSFEDSTVDHITPYSKGGKTVRANAQLAHRGCNARKNAQTPATEAELRLTHG
jgi:5-methylcytosine-specific restriction endonuclease McrA